MGDPDGEWHYSTEGELDPDLTEEAGYADWDPPQRRWLAVVLWVTALLLAAAVAAGVILTALA
ncbi:MAG TPA: hypothetical protein VNL92_01970 [Dehalococcoidia bacterium]|nr:hypothetical protein [Dehalococcoidia bacterium]